MPHYSVHSEGHSWAWNDTPADTAADFDLARAEAEQMSRTSGRNWTVRYNDRQVSRLILTATPEEGIVWPRLASPQIPAAEIADRREREHPGHDVPAAAAGFDPARYWGEASDRQAEHELEAEL
jgi:hypothetical protein